MQIKKANQLLPLNTALPSGFIRFNNNPSANIRLLLLPDWQGANTAYMQRMAGLFSQALNAETVIFHPYNVNTHPVHYILEGRFEVYEVLSDRARCRQWIQEAIAELENHWENKAAKLVMVGFCLGGSIAFEAARTSSAIDLAVSIHGNPSTDLHLSSYASRVPMVFVGGGSDPLISKEDISLFLKEMQVSGRPWYSHTLGESRHSFTKQEVGYIGPGSIYNLDALELSVDLVANHVKQLGGIA
ncbi:dienelactone hydrolase family protein [Pseudoalteromonas xiamenensis]|uniref:dienelactone hydrolase family protein n=1 Tax=Pseudoalteromonas xiamenensis TaxID=882626 RepID=UPI0027E59827|nr:dienelactone hydrolase family protein [Pseudoalteromonas xiamenensis]WMN58790.1 dienelactone hydrolase family protein [Pseudoalteromonas xiamenensis]